MGRLLSSASELFVPESRSLRVLASAVQECRACPLYRQATQAVFGEGPTPADVLFLGEQPGDVEDQRGRPFVGPAGRVLDEGLESAGLDRADVFVTNAVKHFKFERRGKKRIHDKPNQMEMNACRGWFNAELKLVRPRIVVCLGATAAMSLLRSSFRISRHLGEFLPGGEIGPWLLMTYHPAALLRMPDPEQRRLARRQFAAHLAQVSRWLQRARGEEKQGSEDRPELL